MRPKSEVPKEVKGERVKAKGVSKPKAESIKHKADHSAMDIPHSELNKSQFVNRKSEIQPMEVHHHPEVEKKGFKEYLLEGLMIFLAVMMGFIAENIREGITERNKEREFIQSMVSDLKKDTANFRRTIRRNNYCISGLDSLILLLNSPERDQHGSDLYYLARASIYRIALFQPSDRVYDEMKSSGNLRLISKKIVADSITTYYHDLEDWKIQNEMVRQLTLNYFHSSVKVFDGAVFQKMLNDPRAKFPELPKPAGNPPLVSTSKADIAELTGNAHFLYARVNAKVKGSAKSFLEGATSLMKILKKEYNLEDE